jgi:hypothetical protein
MQRHPVAAVEVVDDEARTPDLLVVSELACF